MRAKIFLVALMSMLSVATAKANTSDKKTKIVITDHASKEDAARATQLQKQIDSIEALDFNSLTRAEKLQVKSELDNIKKEVKQMEGVYIYLGGGVLLIILILILLL
ncbi:MAG TPA: hypothetical protein VD905_02050 [Flavobacteriales bacterium]|nr:hypothetical protein [Flavobacteriales bacterium]